MDNVVLELHVWGPSFSLPSVDAQCLAAIAFFSKSVPKGEWVLIPSSDPTLSPTNELPALRDGATWVGGFRNIIQYVEEYSKGYCDLDNELQGIKKADCVAFSSFVESQGQPLLDLSLYVSSKNYTEVTRPLYSTIQPFPLQYLTPPTIRSVAKKRTAHLGLSSLDVDSQNTDTESLADHSIIPERLRKPRETVSSLLNSSPESRSQIRLHALATAFFEPLQALKGSKRFLLSNDTFTTLDCLALAYLSLCLLPDVPQPWLSKCMSQDFPQLASYVHDLQELVFSERDSGNPALPWSMPTTSSFPRVSSIFLSSAIDKIPGVRRLRQADPRDHPSEPMKVKADGRDPGLGLEGSKRAIDERRDMSLTIGSLILGSALFVGYCYRSGLLDRLGANGG